MSSLFIHIKSPDTAATLRSQFQKDSSAASLECTLLSTYFQSLASGVKSGNVEVNTSSATGVKAAANLTLVYASISNNDTCVIGKTTLTCVTGTPANENQFKKETNLATTLANLIAAVNAHSVLSGIVLASSPSAGVCTITCKYAGIIGNEIVLTGSTGMTASASYLASGAGVLLTSVSYSRGY